MGPHAGADIMSGTSKFDQQYSLRKTDAICTTCLKYYMVIPNGEHRLICPLCDKEEFDDIVRRRSGG
jgi:Zn finger protein HypA/HybF involved in hydrogenase expression